MMAASVEDDEEDIRPRPRRRNIMRRVVRRNLGQVSDAEARAWLAECKDIIDHSLHHYRRVIPHTHGAGFDDFRAIAQIAVLEAYIIHDPTRHGAAQRRTWARRLIRQRFSEVVDSLMNTQEVLSAKGTHKSAGDSVPVDMQEQLESRMQIRELDVIFALLSPRQRFLVLAKLNGEPMRISAKTLGISKTRCEQEVTSAMNTLRKAAAQLLQDG